MPELRPLFDGWERADSVVVNPHKWLFTPMDLSVLYCRRMDVLRAAFSLVPDFLKTAEGDAGVRNLMDTGIQLGRRFRSLKLWMVLRALRRRRHPRRHARAPAAGAPVRVVGGRRPALRARGAGALQRRLLPRATADGQSPAEADELNERLMERVNATGEVFLSHTRLDGRFVIRLAIGHYRTAERHVARAWELLQQT